MPVRNTLDAFARASRTLGMAMVLVVVLCACQYRGDQSGIDAISPSGRWATVTEYKGEPADGRLILLDLQSRQPTLLVDGFEPQEAAAVGSFSPDERHVLVCSEDSWLLIDRNDGELTKLEGSCLGGEDWTWAEFLPSGQVLVITGSFAEGFQLDLIEDLTRPQDPTRTPTPIPMISNVRYLFVGYQPLHAVLSSQTTAPSPLCVTSRMPDHRAWTTVSKDGVVTILRVEPGEAPVLEPMPHLSDTVTDLLDRQRALLQSQRSKIEQDVDEDLLKKNQTVDEQERARLVDERLEALVVGSISALPSPDGTKLFFMRFSGDDDINRRYTLYLLDLEHERETPLSSETRWRPYYAFSPDGKQILFESNQGYDAAYAGRRALYLADADAGNKRRLEVPEGSVPCWH